MLPEPLGGGVGATTKSTASHCFLVQIGTDEMATKE
jgi:hypothetical protein